MKDMGLAVIILEIRVKQESDGTLFTYSISLWVKEKTITMASQDV